MAIDAIGSQLRKLVYILLWALGLFLISLIPVVNLIAPVLWVIFGSWLLSLEYFDYPMGNHDLVFDEEKRQLRERRGIELGFGGGTGSARRFVSCFVFPRIFSRRVLSRDIVWLP